MTVHIKEPIDHAGQACHHCGFPVVRRSHKEPPKQNKGGYYFSHWFLCSNKDCKALYMNEEAKIYFNKRKMCQVCDGSGWIPLP